MSVSIALATCNSERFLAPLLASLAAQTRPPAELVAYDDASSDGTPGLLREFAATAPFPVRIAGGGTERRGHVAAFLDAARRCRTPLVAFCDADDVWDERKLEICVRALERPTTQLVLHTTRVVGAELEDLGRNWPAIERSRVAPRLGLTGLDVDAPGMAMVFRRDLLDAADFAGRPPSRYGQGQQMLHDEWVLFLAGVLGEVQLIAEPLVRYRQHDANASGGWVRRERRNTLRPAIEDYEFAAGHTGACADYLERTSASDPATARLLAEGAQAYRRTAESWALRAALYRARGRPARARMMGRLVATQAYRSRHSGGFGRAAIVKDLAAGLAVRVDADDR